MASTWALHVIAVEATRCARREVHVQGERKDAGGHRARDWHTDGSATARPTVRAGATAVGKARSTLYPFFFPPLFPRSDRRPVAPVRHRARFDRAPPRLGHRRLGEPLAHQHGQRPLIDRLVGDLGMVSLSRQPGVKLRRRVCVSIATGEVSQDSFEPRCRPVSTCSGHHGDERGRLRDLGRCGCPDAVTD